MQIRQAAIPMATWFIMATALGQEPWDGPAFSAEPSAMMQAASKIPADAGVEAIVLLQEYHVVFDATGAARHTRRSVTKIVTKKGAESWSATQARWETWYQERPVLRARVITADGRVHELDQKLISEAPANPEIRSMFSDVRVVEAPLPALAPGSIVEEESVVREKAAFYERGVVNSAQFYFGKAFPRIKTRLILEAPASVQVRYATIGPIQLQPDKNGGDGKARLVFEAGRLDDDLGFEPLTSPDVRLIPQVIFSTGKSWADVAQHYSSIVDRQLQNADLRLFLTAGSNQGTPKERASRLLGRVRGEIRYAAVELGDAAVIPRTPKEIVERRHGDCKDLASLMVGLLRATGVPAYVALINAGRRTDPDPNLPGMGMFDHAIVYVPGKPELWMDPTDPQSDAGELPAGEQGRLALIAAPDASALVRTPETSSETNRQMETREFYLSESGPARVVETTESWGSRAQSLRSYSGLEDSKLKSQLSRYVNAEYVSNEISRVAAPDAGFALPAKLVVEAGKARRGFTSRVDAAVYLRLESVVSMLPPFFMRRTKAAKLERRTYCFPSLSFTSCGTASIHHPVMCCVTCPKPKAET